MNHDHETRVAWLKMTATWILTFIGAVTLSDLIQFAALIFTLLQIYILVRDKIIKRRAEIESRRMELDSRPHHHGD